jgi:hypothetical protein
MKIVDNRSWEVREIVSWHHGRLKAIEARIARWDVQRGGGKTGDKSITLVDLLIARDHHRSAITEIRVAERARCEQIVAERDEQLRRERMSAADKRAERLERMARRNDESMSEKFHNTLDLIGRKLGIA